MRDPLILAVRSLREEVMPLAIAERPLPDFYSTRLQKMIPSLVNTPFDDHQIAILWGELQILYIESQVPGDDKSTWGKMRNAADAALIGLLKRKQWGGLTNVFSQQIFSRLSDAVTTSREQRIQACIEATNCFRALVQESTSRLECRWLLIQMADMQYPSFGTSGWRARMGLDFTWRRATAVAQAIIEYVHKEIILKSGNSALPLSIGYDSRINADKVALLVAEVAVANGINVHLAARETPSPALIFYITDKLGVANNAGLINCTPSHNPVKNQELPTPDYDGTEYHGIRYNMPFGAVAASKITDNIGRRAMALLLEERIIPDDVAHRGSVTFFDPMVDYIDAAIRDLSTPITLKDGTPTTAMAQMKRFWGATNAMIVIDEMHSASRGYLSGMLDKLGLGKKYVVIHSEKNPLLGKLNYANPEPPNIGPCLDKTVTPPTNCCCVHTVTELSSQYSHLIGLGFDTDSDRFGVVNANGQYLMTNQMLPMLAHYLLTVTNNTKPGRLIRNVTTTRMLDRIALAHADKIIVPDDPNAIVPHANDSDYKVSLGNISEQSGFKTFVVPVGFKYIAEIIMQDFPATLSARTLSPVQLQHKFAECLQEMLIAGEESNGLTSRGHTPDKDGLWGALLTLQMCAVCDKTLEDLWKECDDLYGPLVSARRDVNAPDVAKIALVNVYLDRYAAMKVNGIAPDERMSDFTPSYCGGTPGEFVEIILQDTRQQHQKMRECYLAIRASGTEPKTRIYVECPTAEQKNAILSAVGEELEQQIVIAIENAGDFYTVLDLVNIVAKPAFPGEDLPATLNDRIRNIAHIRSLEFDHDGIFPTGK